MKSDGVDRLASRACCPKVVEDITEVDVLEEGGFFLKANHARFFHAGENEFVPDTLGGSDGCLANKSFGTSSFPDVGRQRCCCPPESSGCKP